MITSNPLLPAFDLEQRWSTLFGTPSNARVGASGAVMQMTEFQGRLVALAANAGGYARPGNEFAPLMIFTGKVWRLAGAKLKGSVDLLASDTTGLLLAGVFQEGINADGSVVPLGFFAHWDGQRWLNLDEGLTDLIKVRKFNKTFYALATLNGKPNTLAKLQNKKWAPVQQFNPESQIAGLTIKTAPSNFVVSDDEALFVNGSYESPPVKINLSNGNPSEFKDNHTLIGIKGGSAFFKADHSGTLLAAIKDSNGYLLGGDVSGNITFQHPGFDVIPRQFRRNGETVTINTHRARRAQRGEHFDTVNGIFHISSDGKKLNRLEGGVSKGFRNVGVVHVLAKTAGNRIIVGGDFLFVAPDGQNSVPPQTENPNVPPIPGIEDQPKPVILPAQTNGFRPSSGGISSSGLAFLQGTNWSRPAAPFRKGSVSFPSSSNFPNRSFFNNPFRQIPRNANPAVSTVLVGENAVYLGGAFLASGTTLLNNVAALIGDEMAPLMNRHNQGLEGFGSSSGLAKPIALDHTQGDLYAVTQARIAGDLQDPGVIIRFNARTKAWENLPDLPEFRRVQTIAVAPAGGAFEGELFVLASLSAPFTSPDGAALTKAGLFRFDGSRWHGTALEEALAQHMAVDHLGRVHVSGAQIRFLNSRDRVSTVTGLVFFDGVNWRSHGQLRNRFRSGSISDIAQHGKSLYFCGGFTRIGGVFPNHVAVFDGARFHALGKGVRLKGQAIERARVNHITVGQDGLIYVTGDFDEAVNEDGSIVPVKGMAVWKGHGWDDWAGGLDDFAPGGRGAVVREMTATAKGVVIAGQFEKVGGKTLRQFARWDGLEWHALEPDMLADAFDRRGGGFLTGFGEELLMGSGFRTAQFHSSMRLAAYDLAPEENMALRVDSIFEPNFAPLNIRLNLPNGGRGKLEIFAVSLPENPLFEQEVAGNTDLEWDGLIEVGASDELRDGKPVALVSPIHSPLLVRATFGEKVIEGMVEINPYLRFEEQVAKADRDNLLESIRLASGLNEDEVKLIGQELLIKSTRNDRFITQGSPLYRSYLKYLSENAILRLSKSDNPEPTRKASRHHFLWTYEVTPEDNTFLDPFFKVLEDLNA